MTFNVLSSGDPALASTAMQNWRHVNYGSALLPVDASGTATDGLNDFGSITAHWRDAYFGDGTDITMFVDSQNGNVGFGTDVPIAQLQVERLIQPNIAIKTKATSGDETAQLTMGNTADINAFRLIYDNSDDSMSIYTGGRADASTNPFTINSAGELGIGGIPSYLLDANKSSSGSTNTLAIRNTSNTASSNAINRIQIGGTSAGIAATHWTDGTTNYYAGMPAAGNWRLSTNSNLSSPIIDIDTSGNAYFGGILGIKKTSGDAVFSLDNGTDQWYMGIDDSDSENLKISRSSDLSSESIKVDSSSGDVSFPSGVDFDRCSAWHNANQTVSGTLTVLWNQEDYDTNTMHDTSTNSERFVCKTAGLYTFTFMADIGSNGGPDISESIIAGIELFSSGGTTKQQWSDQKINYPQQTFTVTATYYCDADDYFECFVTENTPDTITLFGGDNVSFCHINKVG